MDDDDDDDSDNEPCCPFHCYRTFDAWRSEDVMQLYRDCCKYTRKAVFGRPLLMLGQELATNESGIVVWSDKIFFLVESNGKPLPPINFAACWNGMSPEQFIDIDGEINAPRLLIPPLVWHQFDEGYHIVLDFFHNDWMVRVDDEETIPIPVIHNDIDKEQDEGESRFLGRLLEDAFDEDGQLRICQDEEDKDEDEKDAREEGTETDNKQ